MSKSLSETISSAPVIAGRYAIGKVLGQGGMGAVLAAEDRENGCSVAVKILLAPEHSSYELADLASRLRDEARATQAVKNPHLVKILGSGNDEQYGPFIVFERLPGKTLRDELKNGPMSLEETREKVIIPLLSGLDALHRAGVVHRDIKPENLLLGPSGKYKIGDLGLAFFDAREAHTKTGCIVGTPGYVAPELVTGSCEKPTARADVYAASILIVEVLTGHLPFKGKNAAETLKEQLQRTLTEATLRKLGLATPLCKPLAQAMSLDAHERFVTGAEFLQALEDCGLNSLVNEDSASEGVFKETMLARKKDVNAANKGANSAAAKSRWPPTSWLILLLPLACYTLYSLFVGSSREELAVDGLRKAAASLAAHCDDLNGFRSCDLSKLLGFETEIEKEYVRLYEKIGRQKSAELWRNHFVTKFEAESLPALWALIFAENRHGSRLVVSSSYAKLRSRLVAELKDGKAEPDRLSILTCIIAREWETLPDRSLGSLLLWLDEQLEAMNFLPLPCRRGSAADNHRYMLLVLRAAARFENDRAAGFDALLLPLLTLDKYINKLPELKDCLARHLATFRTYADEKGIKTRAISLKDFYKEAELALDNSAKNRKLIPFIKLSSSIDKVNEQLLKICIDARAAYWTYYATFVLQPGVLDTRQGLTKAARNVADVLADPLLSKTCPLKWWGEDLTVNRAMFTCLYTIRSIVDDCLRNHPTSKELSLWLSIEMASRATRAFCDRSNMVWKEGLPFLDKEAERLKRAPSLIPHYLLLGHIQRARANKQEATNSYMLAFGEMEKISDERLFAMSQEEVANFLEVVKEIVDSSLMSKMETCPRGKDRARQARVLLEMMAKPLNYGSEGSKDRLFLKQAATVNRALGLLEMGDVTNARRMANELNELAQKARTRGIERMATSTLKKLGH